MHETNYGPAYECRIGRIRGVVHQNEGKDGPWYSVLFLRTYVKGGAEMTATTFGRADLLVLAEVARDCWRFVAERAA